MDYDICEKILPSEEKKHDSNSFSPCCSFLITFIFGLVLSILAVVFLIIKKFYLESGYRLSADILLIVLYVLGIIFICVLFNQLKKANPFNKKKNAKKKFSELAEVIVICFVIAILGFGDSLLNLTRMSNQIMDLSFHYKSFSGFCRGVYELSVIENFIKAIYHFLLLFFIIYIKYNHISLDHKDKITTGIIGYLCAVSLGQWVLSVTQEYIENKRNKGESMQCNVTEKMTDYKDFAADRPYLYPLAIEFRMCCLVELLSFITHSWDKHKANNQNNDKDVPFSKSRPKQHDTINRRCFPCFTFLIALFAFLIIVISIGFIMFQNNNISNHDVEILYENRSLSVLNKPQKYIIMWSAIIDIVLQILELFISFILFISTLKFALYSSKKENIETSEGSSSICSRVCIKLSWENKLDLSFLIFSYVFVFIFCSVEFHGLNKTLHEIIVKSILLDKHIWRTTLCLSIIPILADLLQILFIFSCLLFQSKKKEFEKLILFMMMLNIVVWSFDTFSSKEFVRNPLMIISFQYKWETIDAILSPPAIFFHFHLFVMLVKLYFAEAKEEKKKRNIKIKKAYVVQ